MDEPFQTGDNYMKTRFACSFFKKSSFDFKDPLPFRRLAAKPPQRKRLWGLG